MCTATVLRGIGAGLAALGGRSAGATLPAMSEPASAASAPAIAPASAAEQLRRHAAGDQQAFAELVAEHNAAAFACAARITGDGDLAGDVVQEAFLRVLRHGARFDRDRPFRPWLLQIVRNLAIDCLRRRRRFADPNQLADRTASEERAPAAELRGKVATVLADLPDKYASILAMRELEGVAAEDIATTIGCDYGTTRWRLHHARTLFRAAWIRRYGAEWP